MTSYKVGGQKHRTKTREKQKLRSKNKERQNLRRLVEEEKRNPSHQETLAEQSRTTRLFASSITLICLLISLQSRPRGQHSYTKHALLSFLLLISSSTSRSRQTRRHFHIKSVKSPTFIHIHPSLRKHQITRPSSRLGLCIPSLQSL